MTRRIETLVAYAALGLAIINAAVAAIIAQIG